MPRRLARGLDFHVQDLGAGPAVVMLHGLLLGSVATWFFTVAPTLAEGHHVRLVDLRGHGLSERPATGYGTDEMARDVDALTDDLDAPFALVGHSYGALVALRFALSHPTRVSHLALIDAPLPPSELAPLVAMSPEELLQALPATVRDAAARGGRQIRRLLASVGALLRDTSLPADVAAEADVPDDALARIQCPTLCVYGDASPCLPAGRRIARVVPNARLVVLHGGHFLHVDAKGPLTAALREHLDA